MPFPQAAKDNLAATLALANFFTDELGSYLPLQQQIAGLKEVQKLLTWQINAPYQRANAGQNALKKTLLGYLKVESSVDLFMLYIKLPPYEEKTNLAYLTENVQKLVYQWFKDEILRKELSKAQLPDLAIIDQKIKAIVKERVDGYSKRLEGQKKWEWQIFVAEVDADIEVLCKEYKRIFSQLHNQFPEFRMGQLNFMQSYFNRCMLLAQLEEYLERRSDPHPLPRINSEDFSAFSTALATLEKSYQDDESTESLFTLFNKIRPCSLSLEQYKILAELLIRLKPKYDAYRPDQENLTPEALLQKFLDRHWPKPALPLLVPSAAKNEAALRWERMRKAHGEREEKAVALQVISSLPHV